MQDWTSYADHVVLYTVDSEEQLPVGAESAAVGEGLIGRRVSLRVDRVLWSASRAPELPSRLKMRTWGWVLKDGKRQGKFMPGPERVEVGRRYLAPMVFYDRTAPGEWGHRHGNFVLDVEGDRVADASGDDEGRALREKFEGRPVEDVATEVRRQPPHPLARKYQHLRPVRRIRAVIRAGGFDDDYRPSRTKRDR